MKKNGLIVALVCVAAYGGWRWHRSGGGDTATVAAAHDSEHLLVDRLWIDHLPKSDKDTVNVLIVLTQEPVGVFQSTSAWKGEYEVFGYELRGNELRTLFPQNGDRDKIRVDARHCDKGEMDYCLELKGASRGVKKYYSMEGWEVGGADLRTAELRADALVHSLARAGQ